MLLGRGVLTGSFVFRVLKAGSLEAVLGGALNRILLSFSSCALSTDGSAPGQGRGSLVMTWFCGSSEPGAE